MKIKLIDDWNRAHKMMSVWTFAAIAAFPDIYNAIVSLGWSDDLPAEAKWALRVMGVIGIFVRLVKQSKVNIDKESA